jgi:hypothetical protein
LAQLPAGASDVDEPEIIELHLFTLAHSLGRLEVVPAPSCQSTCLTAGGSSLPA